MAQVEAPVPSALDLVAEPALLSQLMALVEGLVVELALLSQLMALVGGLVVELAPLSQEMAQVEVPVLYHRQKEQVEVRELLLLLLEARLEEVPVLCLPEMAQEELPET
jgi:hypothetical protein